MVVSSGLVAPAGATLAAVGFPTHLELADQIADEVVGFIEAEDIVNKRWPAFRICGASPCSLNADGGTNIYAGLETGYQQVQDNSDSGRQNRVILLNNGVATSGISGTDQILEMSSLYNSDGMGLTTVGLGTDFNVELMRGLAERGDSRTTRRYPYLYSCVDPGVGPGVDPGVDRLCGPIGRPGFARAIALAGERTAG